MRSIALAGLWVLAGCEEPLGPMSPATVDAITKTQGDAEGFDRSGQYWMDFDLVDCPCEPMAVDGREPPMIEGLAAFSLCGAIEMSSSGGQIPVDVLATDGVVTFIAHQAAWAELVGPLYRGGDFSAGSVTSIATFAVEGRLVTRLDGDFDRTEIGHELDATLLNRIAGRTTIEAQAIDVDCTERIELSGAWP